jgi:hypothetical protein
MRRKRKGKRAPKNRLPPWGALFDGQPIERSFPRADPQHGEAAEKDAQDVLARRLSRLAEHYGAKSFRELVVAIASQLDPAFTIIDPAPPPSGRQWHDGDGGIGLDGEVLLREFENVDTSLREEEGREVTDMAVLAELCEKSPRYRGMSREALKTRLSEARSAKRGTRRGTR